jgi:hypothetical protein
MNAILARFALAVSLLIPVAAWSQIALSITLAPPALPEYAQPVVPGDGYLWAPGYWSWNPSQGDYFWVPGTWVLAPGVGQLWTPGYWGYEDSGYLWHGGYWGSSVGYYGGINYGYGYTGSGYQGGRWNQGTFQYNRAASNVDAKSVHAIYNTRVTSPAGASHVSFQGGAAGTHAQPTAAQRQISAAAHGSPTAEQMAHEHTALAAPAQRASVSHGAPAVAATPRPSAFEGAGVEPVRAQVAVRSQPAPASARAPQVARANVAGPQVERQAEMPQHSAPRVEPHVEQHAAQQPAEPAQQHAQPAQRAERAPTREESPHAER